ncbi:MAG: hypothetical protein AAB407_03960 [Patescibacteria group bacterium]
MKLRINIIVGLFFAVVFITGFFTLQVMAGIGPTTPNIDIAEPNHWAWNDVIGWIDFVYTDNSNVEVTDIELRGYASSSVGFIALNCDNANPNTINICGTSNFFVSNDFTNYAITGISNLAGWAWNDSIGWISFCGNASGGSVWNPGTLSWNCPVSPTYQVVINVDSSSPAEGEFSGWAWNDIVGWISFNCSNPIDTCATVDYKVKTTWSPIPPTLPTAILESSVFDTCPNLAPGVLCGSQLNTFVWHGALPSAPAQITAQIATDCADVGDVPPNCTTLGWAFQSIGLGAIAPYATTSLIAHSNIRYFKYRLNFTPCNIPTCTPSAGPIVEDVIINWSK